MSVVIKVAAPPKWRTPTPVNDEQPPVPEFSEALLPASVRPWVADIAGRMAIAPEAPAAAVMVALGSVIGRSCGIQPKSYDPWLVVPTVWGGIVSDSATLKSPTIEASVKPLRILEQDERQRFEGELKDWEFAELVRDAKKSGLTKRLAKASASELADLRLEMEATAQPKPIQRRFVINDATVEKLGMLLEENPNGLLVLRDELTGWLGLMDAEGHQNDRAFYLEAWSGTGSYTWDRVGRGTLHVPSCCVSVFGGIQPGPLAEHLRAATKGGAGADGLMQRFQMLVAPDRPTYSYVDRPQNREAKDLATATFERLKSLDYQTIGAAKGEHDKIPWLRFAPDAQELFAGWLTELEHRLRSDTEHDAFVSHLGKYRSLAPALALICHLADSQDGGPVSLNAIQRAAAWCTLLEAHARRVYACLLRKDARDAKAVLRKIREGKLTNPFRARDIKRSGWTGLSNDEDVAGALEVLEYHGWVWSRPVQGASGGRPTMEYLIHPSAASTKVVQDPGPVFVDTSPWSPRASGAPFVAPDSWKRGPTPRPKPLEGEEE